MTCERAAGRGRHSSRGRVRCRHRPLRLLCTACALSCCTTREACSPCPCPLPPGVPAAFTASPPAPPLTGGPWGRAAAPGAPRPPPPRRGGGGGKQGCAGTIWQPCQQRGACNNDPPAAPQMRCTMPCMLPPQPCGLVRTPPPRCRPPTRHSTHLCQHVRVVCHQGEAPHKGGGGRILVEEGRWRHRQCGVGLPCRAAVALLLQLLPLLCTTPHLLRVPTPHF